MSPNTDETATALHVLCRRVDAEGAAVCNVHDHEPWPDVTDYCPAVHRILVTFAGAARGVGEPGAVPTPAVSADGTRSRVAVMERLADLQRRSGWPVDYGR